MHQFGYLFKRTQIQKLSFEGTGEQLAKEEKLKFLSKIFLRFEMKKYQVKISLRIEINLREYVKIFYQ